MRYRKIVVAVLVIFVLLMNGKAWPVYAHADLLQSVPEANAILDNPPPQIELFFSETIKPGFSSIQVLDGNGSEVQIGTARSDGSIPNHLFIPVRSLPDGVYTVSWRTLSAVDGHVSAGVFPFAVGEVLAAELTAVSSQSTSSNSPLETAVRWFIYLAAMSLTGGFLFLWLVWQPAIETVQWQPKEKMAWRLLAIWALLILGGANLMWLLAQAGAVDGRFLAAPWDDSIRRVLFITRFGSLWVARFLLLLILLGLVLQPQTKRNRQISTIVGILLLVTISLGSHAAAQTNPLLPIIGDVLHISAAAFWFGGLFYFVVSMMAVRAGKKETKLRTQFTAILVKRFSNLALICMAVVLLSGVYASVVQLGSWSALWLTDYGLALTVKLFFFILILGFAAFNLFKMSPAISNRADKGGNKQLLNRFFKLIRNEAVLATAVIFSVAVLTVLPTPNNSASIPTVSQSSQQADLDVQLDVVPGRVGLNKFSVRVEENGRSLTTAKEIALNFVAQTSDLPINQVELTLAEDGSYDVSGGYLSLPDLWDVEVVVRRDGELDEFVPFELDLQETAVISAPFPWYRATGALLVAAAVAYLFALTPIFKKQVQTVGLIYFPAIVLVFLGFLALISDPPADAVATGQVFILNPIAADVDSVAVGGILYSENCATCHGPTGAGDGPVGLTLDPPPANLQVHATSGVHPDGELFLWITEGVDYNPVMPAFGDQLDAEERWHLVNFIRTLAN